ncbi:Kinesin-4 [Galdieria sulphuraria]|nr:Kinesin-4 [Galdieria sulphuraria]
MIAEHSLYSTESTTETSDKYKPTGWRNATTFFSSDSTISPIPTKSLSSLSNIHTYRVTVETADVRWAGTDAQIFIRLIGDITTAPEQHLAGGNFERGGIDQFTFDIPHIGNLVKIMVRHDGKGWGSAWMLERIVVKDENLQKTWVCNCSKWLNRDVDNMMELVPTCTNSNSLSSFLQRRISGIFSSSSPAKNLFASNPTNGKNNVLKETSPKTFSPKTESPYHEETSKSIIERPIEHTPSNPISPVEWQCNGSPIVIRFHVNYFTQESQYLYVCGSAKFLGEWNAQKALKMNMFTAPDGAWRGDWRLEVQVSEIEDFQYKYLVVDETNGNITWENGENRKMEFHRHTSQMMKVRDVWHTPSNSRKIITSFTPCDSKTTPKTVNDNATPCFYRQNASSWTDPKGGDTELKMDDIRTREELIEKIQQLQQQLDAKEAKLSHANALLLQKGISAVMSRKDENLTWSRLTDFERENNELRSESETMKEKISQYENDVKILQKETETLKLQFEEEMNKKQELEQQLVQLRQLQFKSQDDKCYTNNASNIQQSVVNGSIFKVKESVQLLSAAIEQVRSEVVSSISQNEERMSHDCQILHRIILENQQKMNELKERWRKEFEWRRRLFNQVQELKGNIRVFCRPRPSRSSCAIQVLEENRLMAKGKVYEFDRVFYPNASQKEVYEETSSLITSVMDGYNVCLFAYGQTGSGKTYTMNGDEANRGVNYRAIEELIKIRNERAEEIQYEIEMSLVEIYNEQLHDLIAGSDESSQSIHSSSSKGSNTWSTQKLEIKLSPQGPYIPDLTWIPVISVEQIWQVMEQASNYRSQGKTTMNDRSSRSHLVISLRIQGRNLINETKLSGKLHLVDLAGSERISRSEATGDRLKEAQHINKSLSCLGDVFMNLLSKNSHIPYRNSKLTFLLQDSLGGDSKTLMFVNVSPEEPDLQESISSLNFASRVNKIQLGPATKHTESQELSRFAKAATRAYEEASSKEEEIRHLKQKLNETTQALHEKEIQLEKWREQLQQEMEHKQSLSEEYKRKEKELDTSRQSLQKLEKQLSEWKEKLSLDQMKRQENQSHTSRTSTTPVALRKRSSPYRIQSPYRNIHRTESTRDAVSKENRLPLTERMENQTEVESSSSSKVLETSTDTDKEATATPKPHRKVKHRVHFEEPNKTSTTTTTTQMGSLVSSKQGPKKVIYAFGSRLEVPLDTKKKSISQPCSSLKRPAGRVLSYKSAMDK